MNDNRNMVLAIVLSALVLIGWSLISDRLLPTAAPQSQTVENGKVKPVPLPGADPTADGPVVARNRAEVLAEAPRVRIETPRLKGSINLRGARIDDLVLAEQLQSIGRESPPIRLLSPAGAETPYFAGFGWTGEGVEAPGADAIWSASSNRLAPGQPVTLSWTSPQGLRFEQSISVDDQFMFTVQQRVANPTAGAVAVRPYGLISRAKESADPDGWTMHVGPIGYFNGAANYDVNWDTLDEAGSLSLIHI